MNIDTAIQAIMNIAITHAEQLTVDEIESLYLGMSALKTIQDGNYTLENIFIKGDIAQ